MTNLLEQEQLNLRRRELYLRSIVMGLVCVSALALSALALALSVYATTYVDAEADKGALLRAKQSSSQTISRTQRTQISSLRARLATILATGHESKRTNELEFIGSVISPGITVRGIQIEHIPAKPTKITLAIGARERSYLLTFLELLQGNAQITRVEYPTSALVKKTDIVTSVTFNFSYNKDTASMAAPTATTTTTTTLPSS